MKNRKPPMRTCVITHEKCEKKDLIRVVRTPEGTVIIEFFQLNEYVGLSISHLESFRK